MKQAQEQKYEQIQHYNPIYYLFYILRKLLICNFSMDRRELSVRLG